MEIPSRSIDSQKADEIVADNKKEIDFLIDSKIVDLRRNYNYSKELYNNRRNKDYINAVKSVVGCIYVVRCDLFHGDKTFSWEEIELLRNCNSLLQKVIIKVFPSCI